MKLLIYGMDACINCREAKEFLTKNEIPYLYLDLAESTGNMRKFLKLRDEEALFAPVKEAGRIGIPCFKLEDGTLTLDINEALEKMGSDVRFTGSQC